MSAAVLVAVLTLWFGFWGRESREPAQLAQARDPAPNTSSRETADANAPPQNPNRELSGNSSPQAPMSAPVPSQPKVRLDSAPALPQPASNRFRDVPGERAAFKPRPTPKPSPAAAPTLPTKPAIASSESSVERPALSARSARGQQWVPRNQTGSAVEPLARSFDRFTAQVTDEKISLVDADGSVYVGVFESPVRPPRSSRAAVRRAPETRSIVPLSASGKSASVSERESVSSGANEDLDTGSDPGEWVLKWFRATGTNRSVSKRVVISGWIRVPVESATVEVWPEHARMNAVVLIPGETNRSQIDASPVPIQAPTPGR